MAKERPKNPDVEKTKKPGPATVMDTPAEPAGSGNPGGPESEVMPEQNPSKTPGAKGKGPSSGNSGKAPASKLKLSTSAEGVREWAQTTLFGGAALAQAIGLEEEEEVTHRLENYTGLLDGFQKLVGVMANGYEDATEDIRRLIASTLDAATERDHTFVAGASQALAKWTTTYQEAMSQVEHGVNSGAACPLGLGPGGRSGPVLPGDIPHHSPRPEHNIGGDLPVAPAGLL